MHADYFQAIFFSASISCATAAVIFSSSYTSGQRAVSVVNKRTVRNKSLNIHSNNANPTFAQDVTDKRERK